MTYIYLSMERKHGIIGKIPRIRKLKFHPRVCLLPAIWHCVSCFVFLCLFPLSSIRFIISSGLITFVQCIFTMPRTVKALCQSASPGIGRKAVNFIGFSLGNIYDFCSKTYLINQTLKQGNARIQVILFWSPYA